MTTSPSLWQLGLALPSALAVLGYAVAAFAWPGDTLQRWRVPAWLMGWMAHAVALLVDVFGLGSDLPGVRFGFAPVLSVTVWLMLSVHALESRLLPLPAVRRALAVVGVVSVGLMWLFPGDVRPMAASAWVPLHWILGVASYGLLAAAVMHGLLLDAAERQLRARVQPGQVPSGTLGLPLLRLERLTFAFVEVGFVVLSLALLLGIGSSEHWRWNHKAVLSLAGWLVFAVLIGARRWRGLRGRRATRWLYVGAVLLLLAYAGTRFVLDVLLHKT